VEGGGGATATNEPDGLLLLVFERAKCSSCGLTTPAGEDLDKGLGRLISEGESGD
jgi:hypothetical protein